LKVGQTLFSQFGESYIIAYGLTANVGVFALFVIVGINQACQPIISFNYGASKTECVYSTLKLGLVTSIGSGLLFLSIIWFTSQDMARFYLGAESELLELSATALLFFFYATPFMGLNLVVANLFQAIAKPNQATIYLASSWFCVCRSGDRDSAWPVPYQWYLGKYPICRGRDSTHQSRITVCLLKKATDDPIGSITRSALLRSTLNVGEQFITQPYIGFAILLSLMPHQNIVYRQ
jgi:hypothetical protein